ncbi:hypothetical protein V6N13_132449 [Hibiscus sabdariffa]
MKAVQQQQKKKSAACNAARLLQVMLNAGRTRVAVMEGSLVILSATCGSSSRIPNSSPFKHFGGGGFDWLPFLTTCLKLKIHSISLKKRFKNLLISCNQVFTGGKGFALTTKSEYISRKSYLLIVRALSGRKVDELDKAISVAARDPSWYGIDEVELESRRRWTGNARTQVGNVKKAVVAGKENGTTASAMHRELMRLSHSHQPDRSNLYSTEDNDDFIASESDRQMLLIKQQDEELDELSASVERIGGVGLTIHEELLAQEKIIDDLGNEMDSITNRLDFVQKKVAMVMKKASAKGQCTMILFLLLLFIILFILVFFT